MNQNRGTGRQPDRQLRERRRLIREREYAEKISRDRHNVQLIYVLFLANFLLIVSALAGVVMAYAERRDTEKWLESHHTWLIRTFWIGLIYLLIGLLLSLAYVGIVLVLMTMTWFLVRMVKGLQALSANRPIDNPHTWIF